MMKARHELWIEKFPYARPQTEAAGRPRVDFADLPFDPGEAISQLKGWEGVEFDKHQ